MYHFEMHEQLKYYMRHHNLHAHRHWGEKVVSLLVPWSIYFEVLEGLFCLWVIHQN